MPRPKPDFDDHIKYFEGLNFVKPSIEKYNNNTKVEITCNEGHVYKLSVNEIKNQGKNPKECPHCKKGKKYKELGIPILVIEEYANNNNVSFYPIKEFYNRWEDSIVFTSNETGFEQEIKSLFHWEKNKPKFIHNRKMLNDKEIEELFSEITIKHNDTIMLPESKINVQLTENVIELLYNSVWHIKEYNGTKTKSIFICKKCGYEKCTNVYNLKGKGINCVQCFKNKQKCSVTNKLIEICKEYNLLLDKSFVYISTESPIYFVCNSCGVEFNKSWAEITGLYYRLKCPECSSNKKFNKENEIHDYIESLGFEIDRRNRNIIFPLELDCYIPKKEIAIEFCGNFWHSSKYNKDNNYHLNKLNKCIEKNIRLITLFEDEWDDKKEICKSRIKNILNLTNNKVFARKCELKSITKEECNNFLDINHIQGKCSWDVNLCLSYNNEIVSVMCFSKYRNEKYDWELVRFCNRIDTSIVGGANKIFQNFIKNNKGKIVSFADRRWSEGAIYELLGFDLDGIIRPRFYYLGSKTNWKRKHRFCYNKKRLKKLFLETDMNKTEEIIAEDNGLYRLYDCGFLRYIYNS